MLDELQVSRILINSRPGVGLCNEEGCFEPPNLCNRSQPAIFCANTLISKGSILSGGMLVHKPSPKKMEQAGCVTKISKLSQ